MTDPVAPAATVNKTEIAALLRTSLPTLDKLLRAHGDAFPVVRRGTNGLAYEFDPAAVTAFLTDLEAARIAAGRARDDLMQQYTLPEIDPPETEGLTPRTRLDLAKLRILEREEAIRAGFLVETSAVRQAVTTAFANLRRDHGTALRQSCRDANIPESVIRAVEARVADAQRTFVTSMQALLNSPDAAHGAEPTLF